MTGDKLLDCREMFRYACDFLYCADLCRTAWRKGDEVTRLRIAPEAVNFAFSCELFLKTLLLFNEIPYKRKHKLEELFNELPKKYQLKIQEQCLLKYGGEKDPFGLSFLSNVSDAFEKWRYCYEYDSLRLEIGFLQVLAKVLREICSQELFNQPWQEYLGE